MKVGAIIFSRMNSKRLPGKALIDISGKSLIRRVIERTKLIKSINHISISTTINSEDDKIIDLAKSESIEVYRGSQDDVLGRALATCKKYNYDHFIRICGDRPFFDVNLYENLIKTHLKNNSDLTTNIFPRNVPPGFSGEVLKVNALKKIALLTSEKSDREHLTSFFYDNQSKFLIDNVEEAFFKIINWQNLRFVVDTEEDLRRAIFIADNSKKFDSKKIISLAIEWEKIKKNKIKKI